MAGINKVILIGNLGKDPEVRFMPSGDAVANITLATSESWKDKNTGEQKENTEWHRVAIFGKLAEIAGEYLKKGSKVYIEGQLQTRKWQNQQGQDQYTTEVVVRGFNGVMQMLDSRNSQAMPQTGGQQQSQSGYQQNQGGYQQQAQNQGGFNQQQQQQGQFQQQQQRQQNQGGYNQSSGAAQKQARDNQRMGGYQQQNQQQAQNGQQQQGHGVNQVQQSPQQWQQQQQQQQQPQGQQPQKVNPQEPDIDFDDDIPFAPVGLMHNNSLMHCL